MQELQFVSEEQAKHIEGQEAQTVVPLSKYPSRATQRCRTVSSYRLSFRTLQERQNPLSVQV